MSIRDCPSCGGARINPVSRAVKVGGKAIHEITCLSIENADEFFHSLNLKPKELDISRRILKN